RTRSIQLIAVQSSTGLLVVASRTPLIPISNNQFLFDKIPTGDTSCSRRDNWRRFVDHRSNRRGRMLSPTLREGLKAYGIGPKIRSMRLKKKMGLVELGRHTGLSPAMLSKIERGRLFPTLPTLLRIAMVFSVGLDYFIAPDRDKPVLGISRHRERLRLPEKAGTKDPAYEFESLDFPAVQRLLNSYFAEFFPVAAEKLRRH